MVNYILLDNEQINVEHFEECHTKERRAISVRFKVKSGKDYHDKTTLLYKEIFDVRVPDASLHFRGRISDYYTSITNLYVDGAVGEFTLGLAEWKE